MSGPLQGLSLHQTSDQTHLEGFHAADPPAGEHELLGPGRADLPRQQLGAAAARKDPNGHLGQPEHRVLRGNDEIAVQGELEPAAQGVAEDGGDGRLRQRPQRVEHRPHQQPVPHPIRVVEMVPFLQVGPDAEGLVSGRCQDHHPCRGIGCGPQQRAGKLVGELTRDGVERLGPVQPDRGDMILDPDLDELHRASRRWEPLTPGAPRGGER